jgi:hypothetical protein
MTISIARLHGEACLICGTTSDALLPTGRLHTTGADGTRRTWRAVVCPAHRTTSLAASLRGAHGQGEDPEIGRGEGMSDVMYRDPELVLLTELCRALAELGLSVGMSDARPAAEVRTKQNPPLRITLDPSGEFFEWHESRHRHLATDPVGAAALIAEQVSAQQPGQGETS